MVSATIFPSSRLLAVTSLLVLAGCASAPTGPSVMALPGTGKSFEQFRLDDADCRHYALSQAEGTTAGRAASSSGVGSAAVGTVVGALAGAAIGGERGAGVGAGTGLVIGSAGGLDAAQRSTSTVQGRYDNAYVQCMYAKGQKVPVSGALQERPRAETGEPRPGRAAPPPPPAGEPPPPPPAY